MVTVKYKKAELHVQAMSLVTDINEYYVYVSVNTIEFIPIFTEVTITSAGKSQTLICLESVFEQASYRSKLVDVRQYKIISRTFPCVNYTGDAASFLNKLGLKCLSKNTTQVKWVETIHNFESLIRSLDEKTVVPKGGAPRWMLDTTGAFVMVDVVQAFTNNPIPIKGSVDSDILDLSWIHAYPGNLNIFYSSVDSIEQIEVKLDEKYAWGKAILNDCTNEELDSFITKFRSEFLFKKYTTRKIVMSKLQTITYHVGDCVLVNSKVQGIVTAINLGVKLNDESRNHTVYIACPE